MSTLDTGLTLIRTAAGRMSAANSWVGNAFKAWMPTGLYARALLIMIVPMVILQSVVAFVFMERHWNTVTRRLSAAVTQDIAALIDQAVEFRTALHNLMQQSTGLVKALKQHRRQSKAIQNTLASIKQLKTLGV